MDRRAPAAARARARPRDEARRRERRRQRGSVHRRRRRPVHPRIGRSDVRRVRAQRTPGVRRIDEASYAAGRSAVLRALLERPTLYATPRTAPVGGEGAPEPRAQRDEAGRGGARFAVARASDVVLRSRLPRTARGSQEAERFLLRLLLLYDVTARLLRLRDHGRRRGRRPAGGAAGVAVAQQEVSPARSD